MWWWNLTCLPSLWSFALLSFASPPRSLLVDHARTLLEFLIPPLDTRMLNIGIFEMWFCRDEILLCGDLFTLRIENGSMTCWRRATRRRDETGERCGWDESWLMIFDLWRSCDVMTSCGCESSGLVWPERHSTHGVCVSFHNLINYYDMPKCRCMGIWQYDSVDSFWCTVHKNSFKCIVWVCRKWLTKYWQLTYWFRRVL